MTPFAGPKVGFITYDLQEFTADCLQHVSKRMIGRLKAYPIFSRVDPKGIGFDYQPSRLRGTFFTVKRSGSTPEGFTSSANLAAAYRCVIENDIIVLFGLQGITAPMAATLGRMLGRKVISVNQTLPLAYEKKRRWWVKALKWYLLKLCCWHVVQSNVSAAVLSEIYGISRTRMVKAPFEGGATLMKERVGALSGERPKIRQSLGWSDAECVFLFVGTLLQMKGIKTLIAAAAELQRWDESFKVVLVGPAAAQPGEPSLQSYEDFTADLSVSRKVQIMGPLTLAELSRIYSAADVLVLPTEKDTWGKVIAEAAVAGLPHITTFASGALGSIVENEESGLVVQPGNPHALAAAMHRLMNRDYRNHLGANAERICRAWCDPDREAEGFASAIELAWSEGRRRL